MTEAQPTIATNRAGEGVAAAINAHVDAIRADRGAAPDLAIATAYFNPGGFSLLADELEAAGRVRLLIGAEPQPEPPPRRSLGEPLSPERLAEQAFQQSLAEQDAALAEGRDLLGFSAEADATARRLITWLADDRVEVKRLTNRFLHGKAFMVETMGGGSMVGSSNFTYAGLATNSELNLFRYDPEATGAVGSWFDEMWSAAEPYDLAAVYANRYEAHHPWTVYLRMLWEQYIDEILDIEDARGVDGIPLPTFNADAVWRALHHLDERGGVLLADDVGLGKTYQAGWLLDDRIRRQRQRALVIAPAILRDGTWKEFTDEYLLPVEIVSFDELVNDIRLNPETGLRNVLRHHPDEYSMVVIDEAHNLRNPATLRAEAVRRLLAGSPPKEVVLITATPVNNSLMDLYHLLRFFIRSEGEFADVGVPSMREHFARAMAIDPEDLTAEALFDILDQVAVRRTRPFIKKYYPGATIQIDGKPVLVTFPTPRVRRVTYAFAGVLPGFFDRLEEALEGYEYEWGVPAPDGVISMARYVPSMYRNDRSAIENYQVQNAGLLRSLLLKRFESSTAAFASTCRTMAGSHDALLEMIRDEGKIAKGRILADWINTEGDDEEVAVWLEANEDDLEDIDDYDVDRLCDALEKDQELLIEFAEVAEGIRPGDDPKLRELIEELATIAAEAETQGVGEQQQRDKRKVLLFSYFADTVNWITDHLVDVCDPASIHHDPRLLAYHGRITSVAGGGDKADAMYGFAPRTTNSPDGADRFDLLIATDVLAEGVNLQQARHVVNYDLPWNPQRLTQRHGRIDRLRSEHDEVFIRCFFPDEDLDRLLDLEATVRRKMRQAIAVFGGHDWIENRQVSVDFAETREELRRLLAEDAHLFEEGSAHALGGEEFRQQLRQVRDDQGTVERVTALPYGAGSGFTRIGGAPGWIFCARVADHPRPVFRFLRVDPETFDPLLVVDADTGDKSPDIDERTLTCLAAAQPFPSDAPRVLPDRIAARAYEAWEMARADIVDRWNWAADPANLRPRIPKAMRDAADLVLANPGGVLTVEQVDDLSMRLLSNYPERISRTFRAALSQETDDARLAEIRHQIDTFGLQRPEPIDPNKPIDAEDVRLVCWLAVSPSEPPATTLPTDAPR